MPKLTDILIIADTQVRSVPISGGDRVSIELAKHWVNMGYNVHLITCAEGRDMFQRFGANSVDYKITTPSYNLPIPLTYLIRIIKGIFLILSFKNTGNYVIFCSSDWWPDSIPLLAKKLLDRKAKCLTTVYHFIPPPSKRPGGLTLFNLLSYLTQRLSLPFLVKWSDLLYTETNFVKNKLALTFSLSHDKIISCESGIDTEVIDSVHSTDKIYDACYIARLHKSKGILDLIEAWKYVCKQKSNARLAIAGKGSIEMTDQVNKKILDLGLQKNVIYLGFLSEENKYKLFKASKIYVLPSYEEGIPITFYEAMYCGLPIVTYYLPTYCDISDYIINVHLGDVRLLGSQILNLISDEKLAQSFSKRGVAFAKKHTWDSIASFLIKKMENI